MQFGLTADCRITLEDAWELCAGRADMAEDYANRTAQWNWPPLAFDRHPWWAFWFSRIVLADHWPDGERLIQQDPDAWAAYQAMCDLYVRLGILDHTIQQEEAEPVVGVLSRPTERPWEQSRRYLSERADQIADELTAFRRQKQSVLNDDDHDFLDGD